MTATEAVCGLSILLIHEGIENARDAFLLAEARGWLRRAPDGDVRSEEFGRAVVTPEGYAVAGEVVV